MWRCLSLKEGSAFNFSIIKSGVALNEATSIKGFGSGSRNRPPPAHSPITTDWARQVDALVFTQMMFPSTKGPMAPDGTVLTDQPAVPRVRERE